MKERRGARESEDMEARTPRGYGDPTPRTGSLNAVKPLHQTPRLIASEKDLQSSDETFQKTPCPGSNRVRGPAEVRAARADSQSRGKTLEHPEDDELVQAVKGADFRTLQQLIAKGIVEAESGASRMEASLNSPDENDEDLRRHRDAMRRRREEAAEASKREREQARLRRQKEWEEQQRRCHLEIEREEQEVFRQRNLQKAREAQCVKEMRAATKIQAHIRGRKSRSGQQLRLPVSRAILHTTPVMQF